MVMREHDIKESPASLHYSNTKSNPDPITNSLFPDVLPLLAIFTSLDMSSKTQVSCWRLR